MVYAASLPVLSQEQGLMRYLAEIRQFPILAPDEEMHLATRWRLHQDRLAAQTLITSHLRLVVKIAFKYKGYGLPISEVISEGNIGLMQAVKRFDPAKGFRLATYAVWWIRASIQEFVLRSWSLVRIGTTAAQKRLFFNLRRAKSHICALEDGDLRPDQVVQIAHRLDVSPQEVVDMNRRLAGDHSLNAPLRIEGEGEWQDFLVDETETQEHRLVAREERHSRYHSLRKALTALQDRERQIFIARRLQDPPSTLEELSEEYGISRERIRQIEARAFEKVQTFIRADTRDVDMKENDRVEGPPLLSSPINNT